MGLTTTKEWRWDAPGAHALTGAVGSARVLLRDFLLECGWSVIWEDAGAQKVVLRNSLAHGGSGCYVRILDDGSFTGGSRVARIDVYEDMSDIDTGVRHGGGGYFWKDRTGSGGPNTYTLHGDERTMYWCVHSQGSHGISSSADGCKAAGWLGDYLRLDGSSGSGFAGCPNQNPSTISNAQIPSGLLTGAIQLQEPPNYWRVPWGSTCFFTGRNHLNATEITRLAVYHPGGLHLNSYDESIGALKTVGDFADPPVVLPALIFASKHLMGRLRGAFINMCNNVDAASTTAYHVIGDVVTPVATSRASSLAVINGGDTTPHGALFVERVKSWDDV